MTVAAGEQPRVSTPRARELRARLRRLRRQRHAGALGEMLTDAYVIVLFVAMYGWMAYLEIADYLRSPAVEVGDAGQRHWMLVAALLATAGLAWRGLRAFGPLIVTPAAQAWLTSSPVDRRSWLLPRFGWLTLIACAGAALLAAGVTAASGAQGVAWAALAGGAVGVSAVALSVVAQGARREPRWPQLLGVGLPAVGAALALLLVVADRAGLPTPPSPAPATYAGLVLAPLAVAAMLGAYRALPTVDRAALAAGTRLTGAAVSAAVLLDPTFFTGLVEERRWRAVGRVRSRPMTGGGRFRVLLRAELRRLLRHPSALGVCAALLLTAYAVAVALPSAAGVAHVILAYLAASRLVSGLRAVHRSPGLRRSLGGGDVFLRLTHLVVPGVGAALWYLAALPAVRPLPGLLDVVLLAGVVAAADRTATRPPMRYDGMVADTPFGMIPVGLLRQVIRGPDLVATLVLVAALWG